MNYTDYVDLNYYDHPNVLRPTTWIELISERSQMRSDFIQENQTNIRFYIRKFSQKLKEFLFEWRLHKTNTMNNLG